MHFKWTIGALACVAATAGAQDVSRGALLYDTQVLTDADLRFQVERWTTQTGRAFTEADREDLIAYLDASHYRLDRREPPRR